MCQNAQTLTYDVFMFVESSIPNNKSERKSYDLLLILIKIFFMYNF